MKNTKWTIIHIVVAVITIMSVVRGQQRAELVPYRMVPDQVYGCHFVIEIIQPVQADGLVKVHKEEVIEILEDRIVFEETNQWAINETFFIDGKPYLLLRVPYTMGESWLETSLELEN